MPCYSPLAGWRARERSPSGKRKVVFDMHEGLIDLPVFLPCGQCIGCRLKYSRDWALRCVHEASQWQANCFITLTYNDQNVPKRGSIDKEHPVLFMKRLRKRFGAKIRSFGAAEYGENFGRPHYHILLFNFDFPDRELFYERNGVRIYTSSTLDDIWGLGYTTVGDVNFQSAAYVARYVMKKQKGKLASLHYERWDAEKQEYYDLVPERPICVSRRPGVGRDWYETYKDQVFPDDFVVHDGKKLAVPKYYSSLLELDNPEMSRIIKAKRKNAVSERAEETSLERLRVKEYIQRQKLDKLKRTLK